jgi:hypothetical protein
MDKTVRMVKTAPMVLLVFRVFKVQSVSLVPQELIPQSLVQWVRWGPLGKLARRVWQALSAQQV